MRIQRNRTIPAIAFGLVALTGTANAQFSSAWTLASDYDYRGITQSDENPALQISLDYSHASGWYLGAWASNVKFQGYDGRLELDLAGGFTGTTQGGLEWDAGLMWYTYPGSAATESQAGLADFPEVYFALGRGPVRGRIRYSHDFSGTGETGLYVEVNTKFRLPSHFCVLAHVGHSSGRAIDRLYQAAYVDYSAGIGYSAGNFDLALRYLGNDTDPAFGYRGRAMVTIETRFPWRHAAD